MKNFSIFVLFLFSIHSFAQQKKVIIISNKYEFQKEKNTYNINTMLKAILVSNNYQVFFDDEVLPVEIAQNKCNALTGVLVDNSNMFLTKMKFQIRDCQNNLLFETAEVKTREKDIQNAYIETIGLLSPELKKYKPVVTTAKEVVVETKSIEVESVLSTEKPLVSEFKTFLNCSFEKSFDDSRDIEIVGTEQNVLLFLQRTKTPNVFIAYKEGVNGIFTKTDNKGIFEYYIGAKYMVEEYLF
jgi:RNA recognition motif-containing protein